MASLSPRDGTRQPQRLDSANEKDVIKIDPVTVTEEPRAVDGKGHVITAKGARVIVHRAGPRDRRASLRKEGGPVGLRTRPRQCLQSGSKAARWDAATVSICTRRTRPKEARISTRSASLERDAVFATILSLIRNFSRSGKRSRRLIMINWRIRLSWWPLLRRKGGQGVHHDPGSHEHLRGRADRIRVRDHTHLHRGPPHRGPLPQDLLPHPDRLGLIGREEEAIGGTKAGAVLPASTRRADRVDTAVPLRGRGRVHEDGGMSDARWPALPLTRTRVSRGYSYRRHAGPRVPSGEGCRGVQSRGPRVLIIQNSIPDVHQQTPLNTACRS